EYIAGLYGVRMANIIAANHLDDPNRLIVGQQLLIPRSAEEIPTCTPTPTPSGGLVNYVVERGDTIGAIAIRFDTSAAAIRAANGLRENATIRPGDVLLVPLPTPANPGQPTPTPAPTATSPYRWIAPILLGPPDGTLIASVGTPVLRWAAVGLLDSDEWYVVRVWPEDSRLPRPPAHWTKGTSWRVGIEWRPPDAAPNRRYFWQVVIARGKGNEDNLQAVEMTSAPSVTRSFIWGLPVSSAAVP
ncbi:MAG: LysM peptidoglycan-binding domain-containing protein, partial [Anaerolineae bacterium]|nr:LysM peptidoglycan-binding domain-containing protein [Anaerolineae bacterium]